MAITKHMTIYNKLKLSFHTYVHVSIYVASYWAISEYVTAGVRSLSMFLSEAVGNTCKSA